MHIKAPDGTPMANAMLAALHELGLTSRELRRQHRADGPERGDVMRTGARALHRGARLSSRRASLSGERDPSCSCWRSRSRRRPTTIAGRGAAMRRTRPRSRALLKAGADVNAAQGDGMTALHWAAHERRRRSRVDAALRRRERRRDDAPRRLHAAAPRRAGRPRRGHRAAASPRGANAGARHLHRRHAADAGGGSGNADAVRGCSSSGADVNVNADESANGETRADVRRRRSDRADVDQRAPARTAPTRRRTSKAVDLTGIAAPEETLAEHRSATRRTRRAPAARLAPAAGAARRDSRGVAGVTRAVRLQRADRHAGRLHRAALRGARRAARRRSRRSLDAGADVNRAQRRRPRRRRCSSRRSTASSTSRQYLLDARRQSESRRATTAWRRSSRCSTSQWAPRTFYPQPRAQLAAEDVVPRR